jgi:hypothetical protein
LNGKAHRGDAEAQRTRRERRREELRDDHSQSLFEHRSECLQIILAKTIIGQIRQIRKIRSQQFCLTLLEPTARTEIERKSSPQSRRGAKNSQRTRRTSPGRTARQSFAIALRASIRINLAKTIIGQIRPIPEIRSQQ